MGELAQKDCVPCKGGVPPLKGNDLARAGQANWAMAGASSTSITWNGNINSRISARRSIFTNKVGELAEQQNHHPDIYLAWGKVKLTLWTHKIDGLTESDFVFAAKVNQL